MDFRPESHCFLAPSGGDPRTPVNTPRCPPRPRRTYRTRTIQYYLNVRDIHLLHNMLPYGTIDGAVHYNVWRQCTPALDLEGVPSDQRALRHRAALLSTTENVLVAWLVSARRSSKLREVVPKNGSPAPWKSSAAGGAGRRGIGAGARMGRGGFAGAAGSSDSSDGETRAVQRNCARRPRLQMAALDRGVICKESILHAIHDRNHEQADGAFGAWSWSHWKKEGRVSRESGQEVTAQRCSGGRP